MAEGSKIGPVETKIIPWAYPALGLAFIGFVLAAFLAENWLWLGFPFLLIAVAWGLRDFRILYLLIWATIPFAIEIDLPGGLSTDFPAEPIMWMCCLMLPVYLLFHRNDWNSRQFLHPVFLLLALHFSWILITSVSSQVPLYSFKYMLAKGWYLVCFILIPLLLLRRPDEYRQWGRVLFIPLVLSIVIIMVRHSFYGFSFSTINNAVIPIYRNHVDYACLLGLFLPFCWWMRKHETNSAWRKFYGFSTLLILAGIYFSYTRAAWLSVPIAFVVFFSVRLRLLRAFVPIGLAIGVLLVGWLSYNNRYLDFSPDFSKAITHRSFDELVSASYKMEDISTVERFYRWVAGYYMVRDKPWIGFGPSTFYSQYQSYVDRHFTTYVSNNPEHSGIHNYYLMTAVEQGLPGLLILLALLITVLYRGERAYHTLAKGPERDLVMAAIISFCINLFILTLNDTVETDKLGTLFFLCMAIVIQFDPRSKPQNLT